MWVQIAVTVVTAMWVQIAVAAVIAMWVRTAVPAVTAMWVQIVGAVMTAMRVRIAVPVAVEIASGIGKFQAAERPETVVLLAAPVEAVEPQLAPAVRAVPPALVVAGEVAVVAAVDA